MMLIFFDIDGTLLDEETFTIPTSTIEAIQQAKNNGHKCFINTGRPISTIDPIVKEIPFDGYICGCGTYVEYQEKVIHHSKLSSLLRKQMIKQIYDYKLEAILEGKDCVYFPTHMTHPTVISIYKRYKELNFAVYTYRPNDDICFDKLAIWFHQDSNIEDFKQIYEKTFEFICRADDFYEVVPLPHSKATGIQTLLDHLKLPVESTMSIGDSTNDLPMLNFTYYSVAMKNSHEELFNKVTYVTTDIKDNGIYNALKHYKII